MEALQFTYADIPTQTDLPRTERVVNTWGCMEFQYLEIPLAAESSDRCQTTSYYQGAQQATQYPGMREEDRYMVFFALSKPEQQPCFEAVQGGDKTESNLELTQVTQKMKQTGLLSPLSVDEEHFPTP